MDDPKIFRKIFLAQTILNGPIRKVIILKVKFEDMIFLLPGYPGSKVFPRRSSSISNSMRIISQVSDYDYPPGPRKFTCFQGECRILWI